MTALAILSGVTSLGQLKSLLPVAYQHRNIGDDEFVAAALSKAQAFDPAFCTADLESIIGIDRSRYQSPPTSPVPPENSAGADAINQHYAWIEANASIYRLEYGDFIDPAKFRTQLDNQTISIQSGDNSRSVGAGTAWLKARNRRQHRQLVIRPSEGLVTADNCLNEWRGFAVQPVAGPVEPFGARQDSCRLGHAANV
jgi:hypothetical protein